MNRFVFLDSGVLGLSVTPPGHGRVDECRAWLRRLEVDRVLVVVPEIVDYEVRREIIRRGASAGLRRLDVLVARFSLSVAGWVEALAFRRRL